MWLWPPIEAKDAVRNHLQDLRRNDHGTLVWDRHFG
jgi:hypothetical protein